MWEFLKHVVEAVKDRPLLRAAVAFVALYLAAAVSGYEFIQWHYGFAPPLDLYLGSYVFAWISLVIGGGAVAVLLYRVLQFLFRPRVPGEGGRVEAVTTRVRRHWRSAAWGAAAAVLVLLLVIPMWVRVSPRPVRNIRVKLLVNPDDIDAKKHFDPEALAYLVYELNKRQRKWHFDLDLSPVNSAAIRDECEGSPHPPWCTLETWCQRIPGEPCIGLTTQKLGDPAKYWQHRDHLSVITTYGRNKLVPLNRYDYLAYCLIVQGIAIHVDTYGRDRAAGGAAPDRWAKSRSSSGDVLDIAAPSAGFKGTILAGRLSPGDRELLLRNFGPDYLRDCSELLTLDWLHAGRVAANLEQYYGVTFTPPPPPPAAPVARSPDAPLSSGDSPDGG